MSVDNTMGAVENELIKYPGPGKKPPADWSNAVRALKNAMRIRVLVRFAPTRGNTFSDICGIGFVQ